MVTAPPRDHSPVERKAFNKQEQSQGPWPSYGKCSVSTEQGDPMEAEGPAKPLRKKP